jgi:hypothetical protein
MEVGERLVPAKVELVKVHAVGVVPLVLERVVLLLWWGAELEAEPDERGGRVEQAAHGRAGGGGDGGGGGGARGEEEEAGAHGAMSTSR